ncbi:hypothetical protein Tco_1174647 [Tanacetum coccineum]
MNQEEIQQAARDETLVPTAERVKISSTNMRIDPTLTQREETFQVVLDLIKASPCYNAFLVTADVLEIYMQQFWFTVKKIKKTTSYEFDLADKKCKQSEAYKAFIAFSTGLIPPKKTIGKGSKGKKQPVTPKRESLISADDNIIPEPNVSLELGKPISKIESEIAEEERLPTGVDKSDESDGEPANRPTGRRRPSGVAFIDTSSMSKKKSLDRTLKLKGIQVMSEEEQLVDDAKKAIKASKEALKLQQQETGDSSEGAGITLEVPNELTGKFTTSSEGAGIVPKVLDEEDQAEDDIVGILVTMSQKEKLEVPQSSSSRSLSSNYGNQFLNVSFDTYLVGIIKDHADTEINSLFDVQIQLEIPPVLSAPLLDLLVSVIPLQITTTTTPTPITTPITTPPITPPLPATEAPDAPVPLPKALTVVLQRVSTLEKEVKELKQVDHTTVILESIRSQVPLTVNEYLGLSLEDSLQKVLQKHTEELKQELKQQESQKIASEIIKIEQEHASKQKWPKHLTTPFDKTVKNEYKKQKDILFQMMMASKSNERHPTHKDLYDALI